MTETEAPEVQTMTLAEYKTMKAEQEKTAAQDALDEMRAAAEDSAAAPFCDPTHHTSSHLFRPIPFSTYRCKLMELALFDQYLLLQVFLAWTMLLLELLRGERRKLCSTPRAMQCDLPHKPHRYYA